MDNQNSYKNNLRPLCGSWHIDLEWGVNQFESYLHNISLMENGATIPDLFKESYNKSKEIHCITENNIIKTVTQINDIPAGSILELSFNGVMREDDGFCSIGIDTFSRRLYEAYASSNVKGILLNLYTGGGQSTSGYTLQQAIADKNKPVVVRTSFLGSAGVNAAVAADEIIAASEGAMIGSIGSYISVNMAMLEYFKTYSKDIYAKVSPDKNKSFREALVGNFDLLEAEVTENAKTFQKMVSKYRDLNPDLKDTTLAGGMFQANDAKKRGLVDAIGTRAFALKRINSLLNIPKK